MNLRRFLALAFASTTTVGLAHSGHDATALHLHIGSPSLQNGIELWLLATGIAIGAAILHHRLNRSR